MASAQESKRLHSDISLAGLRAEATAVGLIQLIKELHDGGVLSHSAVQRIEDKVIDDLALSRPHRLTEAEFRERLRRRLERLLHGDPVQPFE